MAEFRRLEDMDALLEDAGKLRTLLNDLCTKATEIYNNLPEPIKKKFPVLLRAVQEGIKLYAAHSVTKNGFELASVMTISLAMSCVFIFQEYSRLHAVYATAREAKNTLPETKKKLEDLKERLNDVTEKIKNFIERVNQLNPSQVDIMEFTRLNTIQTVIGRELDNINATLNTVEVKIGAHIHILSINRNQCKSNGFAFLACAIGTSLQGSIVLAAGNPLLGVGLLCMAAVQGLVSYKNFDATDVTEEVLNDLRKQLDEVYCLRATAVELELLFQASLQKYMLL